MYIRTKKIRIVSMTVEEMNEFIKLMDQARGGQLVNYAEKQLQDGSYLGVQLTTPEEYLAHRQPKAY